MIWLDNARILAIIAVLVVHVTGSVVTDTPLGSQNWWVGNVFSALTRWCVPVFVMISGMLLLDPAKHEDLSGFYRRRVSRLFWPIAFWSVAYMAWNAAKGLATGSAVKPAVLLQMLASGKPHYHMWFLYMIVFLYLFAPYLSKVTTYTSTRHLMMVTAFMFVIAMLDALSDAVHHTEPALFAQWFLAFIPYYVAGEIVRRTEVRRPALLFAIFMVGAAVTALGCHAVSRQAGLMTGMYFYQYLSVTVVPMSMAVMYLMKYLDRPIFGRRINDRMTGLTLGIYLIHPVILEAVKALYAKPNDFPALVYVPLLTAFIFFTSLGCAWVMSKTPGLRRVI